MWLFTARVSLILLLSLRLGYARCRDPPTIDDSCYVRALQAAGLSWTPAQSCSAVDEYEVLHTQCACNASNSTPTTTRVQDSYFILRSSETYCIQVRAVNNESIYRYSRYSTCVQVGSTEEDQLFNVVMHDNLCIPATFCHDDQLQSNLILSNTQELLHLTWDELNESIPDANVTYNDTTDMFYFCFYNVTNSFLFLEFCLVRRNEEMDTTFCSNWLEFVTRRCVNVNGNGGCSDSLPKPFVAPSRISSTPAPSRVSSTPPDILFITSSSMPASNTPTDVSPPIDVAAIAAPVVLGVVVVWFVLALAYVVAPFLLFYIWKKWQLRKKKKKETRDFLDGILEIRRSQESVQLHTYNSAVK